MRRADILFQKSKIKEGHGLGDNKQNNSGRDEKPSVMWRAIRGAWLGGAEVAARGRCRGGGGGQGTAAILVIMLI